jgi:hypothetical protein
VLCIRDLPLRLLSTKRLDQCGRKLQESRHVTTVLTCHDSRAPVRFFRGRLHTQSRPTSLRYTPVFVSHMDMESAMKIVDSRISMKRVDDRRMDKCLEAVRSRQVAWNKAAYANISVLPSCTGTNRCSTSTSFSSARKAAPLT